MDDVKFNKKQADLLLVLMADAFQDVEESDEELLDFLEQSGVGSYLDTLSEDELAHYGVLGMKWGVRKATKKANRIERKTRKLEKRYARGKDLNSAKIKKQSKRQRKYSYKTNKQINKITKYIKKNSDGGLTVSNSKATPAQIELAKQYLSESKALQQRYRDIGTRLDSLKLDFLIK